MTRLISKRQEQVYRLRHHAFGGLSPSETARVLGITVTSVGRILLELRKIAPQLFPILTRKQADVYYLYVYMGLSRGEITRYLNISNENFAIRIQSMRHKDVFIPWVRPKRVLYKAPMHDHQIKRKF